MDRSDLGQRDASVVSSAVEGGEQGDAVGLRGVPLVQAQLEPLAVQPGVDAASGGELAQSRQLVGMFGRSSTLVAPTPSSLAGPE